MKKMIFLVSALVLMFATSCLSVDAGSNSNSAKYKGTYTITNLASGAENTVTDVIVEVTIPNSSKNLIDFTFNNLTFAPGGMPPQNITIADVPFTPTISEGGIVKNSIFEAYNIVPQIGGVPYNQYLVSEIKGSIGVPVTIYFICKNTKTDIDYKVEFTTGESEAGNGGGSPTPNPTDDIKGKYLVTNTTSDTTTESAGVAIDVSFASDSNDTMSITFKGLTFSPGMPAQDIMVENIPYIVVDGGVAYELEGSNIVPKVQGAEYPQFLISEIKGVLGSIVTIEFTLSQMPYKVVFTNQE